MKNATLITFTRHMHAVAWCSGKKEVFLYGSVGEMDYGNEAAAKNNEPGNLFTKEAFVKYINRKDRPEVLLIYRTKDTFFDVSFRFSGERKFKDGPMCIMQLKPGAMVTPREKK